MGEGDTKVHVDEMFESFVKNKLLQLGMKRAPTKSTDGGTMNELELSIKTRLEKNIAQNSMKDKNNVDSSPKAKKRKREKKHKKKDKKKDIWLEKEHTLHDKERKSKKEKLHKKKKSSKEKKKGKNSETEKSSEISDKPRNVDKMENFQTTSKITETAKSDDVTDKKLVESEKIPTENKFIHAENMYTTRDVEKLASTSQEIHLKKTVAIKAQQDVSSEATDAAETSDSMTAGPKKDIATIKMKIELLKAKSEGEKVQQQVDVLLKKSAQGQNNDSARVQENCSSERKSESKELKRSRSRSKSRKHSKSHSRRHTTSQSRSRDRRHTNSRHHRSRSPSKRSRHRSRSRDRHQSKRSRRHSRSPLISTEDKVRLLEIAKANALAQHRAGQTAISFSSVGQIVKEGTLSVRALTDLCKDISTDIPQEPLTKESAEKMIKEAETNKAHHPFAVKDTAITFNIKQIRSVAIKPPPAATQPLTVLSKEFPVSCGQQHRRKEVLESVYGKWQVVAKDEATKKAVKELVSSDKVFAEPEQTDLNLSSVIADRISAVRQLQDNPNSKDAQEKMDTAQKALNDWTKSQQVPGQFTGRTGLTAMPRSVLEGGKQAWFKADNFKNAKHVTGIGKSLLQKMGWTPGMPLGKTMPGQLEPLSVTFKTDRRGLSSFMEVPAAPAAKKTKTALGPDGSTVKDLSTKHPVSALMEICSKRHWPSPDFRLLDPLNLKFFTYRVIMCNNEYIGTPAGNKKQAKMLAATAALKKMGLVPKT